ncbi:MAG TPA: acyltransferase, partial [Bacillota bacterium]
MRRIERHPVPPGRNSMHQWPRVGGFWRVVRNFVVITVARYVPWLGLKNALYRLIGMRVGRNVAFGLMAMPDVFFPE